MIILPLCLFTEWIGLPFRAFNRFLYHWQHHRTSYLSLSLSLSLRQSAESNVRQPSQIELRWWMESPQQSCWIVCLPGRDESGDRAALHCKLVAGALTAYADCCRLCNLKVKLDKVDMQIKMTVVVYIIVKRFIHNWSQIIIQFSSVSYETKGTAHVTRWMQQVIFPPHTLPGPHFSFSLSLTHHNHNLQASWW